MPIRLKLICSLVLATSSAAMAATQPSCDKPVYLTFDTGHMGVAPLIADVLKREQVHVTFFAANEATKTGGTSLDAEWAPWWKARAAEGHEFASHTYDHVYWRGDVVAGKDVSFKVKPSAGPRKDEQFVMTSAQYCEEIGRSEERLRAMTGKEPLPLFRAPGGKTSPRLQAAAKACGYAHVGWAPAVLEPLIKGLKERGFCFRTLREHPDYAGWTRKQKQ